MSTRGVIARTTEAEGTFRGVYNHSDSYPTWMGPYLWNTLHTVYGGNLAEMLRQTINQHPAGWSQVGQECYCHPQRDRKAEGANWITHRDVPFDIEWVWVFDEESNFLFVRDHRHKEDVAVIDLAGPEPDWKVIQCGEELERCTHYAWVHFPELKGTNIGTHTYLGRQPFKMHDAIAVIVEGKRYQLTGSGGVGSWMNRGRKVPWPNNVWIASVKARNGRTTDLPIAYVGARGAYTPYRGVTWVFPPIKDNPAETLVSK